MGRSALILDPDPASGKLEKLLLRRAGWAVVVAQTQDDASGALELFRPDVMIIGSELEPTESFVDGLVARGIPVVVIASPRDAVIETAALTAGRWSSIESPIDVGVFAELVERARGG